MGEKKTKEVKAGSAMAIIKNVYSRAGKKPDSDIRSNYHVLNFKLQSSNEWQNPNA